MEALDKTPEALLNKPEVLPHLFPIWEAFWFLHPSRPQGMAPGAIPLTEMISYFRLMGLTVDLPGKVLLLRSLDVEFLLKIGEK